MKRKHKSELAFLTVNRIRNSLIRITQRKMGAFVSFLIALCVLFSVTETFPEHPYSSRPTDYRGGQNILEEINAVPEQDRDWASSATAGASENNSFSADRVASIPEKVRRSSELMLAGDTAGARDLIAEAMRECESLQGSPDCATWGQALRGLKSMIGRPTERVVTTNSIGMKLVRIPAGEYMMGSPKQEMDWLRLTFKKIWREGHKQWFQDEMPLHPVRITKPFYMGATTVTVGQFRHFVKENSYKTDAEKGDGGMIYSKKEERWVPQKSMKWDNVPWTLADNQPVVFVSWNDAQAFCRWLSRKEKRTYRLPTEAEWEMGCRGGSAWVTIPLGRPPARG